MNHEELVEKRDSVSRAAQSEPDAFKRGQLVLEWMRLDERLKSTDLERRGSRDYKTQPRDDIGRWTDGAGKLSVSHVHDVMKAEGIHEQHHHDEVKAKIESGELKTREDVLKHIDAIHEARKNADHPSDADVDDASKKDKHSEPEKKALKDAHDKKKIRSKDELDKASKHLKGKGKDASPSLVDSFLEGYRHGKSNAHKVLKTVGL